MINKSSKMAKAMIKRMDKPIIANTVPCGELVLPNRGGDHSPGTVIKTPTQDTDIANKKYVDDTAGGGGNVEADANLTDETIVQGDGGAKKVKTSTATVAQIASNVTHKTSDGSDHTFINQDVTSTGTPEFGITTLADTSVLKTSAAPLADAQIANKKYVDDTAGGGGNIATGNYSGDGTIDQGITGIGFQPKMVQIWYRGLAHATVNIIWFKSDQDQGTKCIQLGTDIKTREGKIITLDADGFSVDDQGTDAAPNKNGEDYNFIAWG